jgi:hypothetical protein
METDSDIEQKRLIRVTRGLDDGLGMFSS